MCSVKEHEFSQRIRVFPTRNENINSLKNSTRWVLPENRFPMSSEKQTYSQAVTQHPQNPGGSTEYNAHCRDMKCKSDLNSCKLKAKKQALSAMDIFYLSENQKYQSDINRLGCELKIKNINGYKDERAHNKHSLSHVNDIYSNRNQKYQSGKNRLGCKLKIKNIKSHVLSLPACKPTGRKVTSSIPLKSNISQPSNKPICSIYTA